MEFDTIYNTIDQLKDIILSEEVSNIFLDLSKNDFLALFFLMRREEANMGQIAEYLHAPLNTASGVVDRLVKKGLISRLRGENDRRVVLLRLTGKAQELLESDKNRITGYYGRIMEMLDDDEKRVLGSLVGKIRHIFISGSGSNESDDSRKAEVRRIPIG